MKKKLLVLLFSGICVIAVAQEKTEKKAPRNGNGAAMQNNLNEPNAINPAMNNNQQYDKGTGRIKTSHPGTVNSNKYNSKSYNKKNETEKKTK